MAVTQADRDKLLRELLDAERRVEKGDYSVTFRPVEEIRSALELIDRELGAQTDPVRPRTRQVRIFSEKGL
jgi:hypothetical protein